MNANSIAGCPTAAASRALINLFLCAFVLIGCGGDRAQNGGLDGRGESRPNVVVFLFDTLRPDYLEMNGFDRETAPFLASLAEDSVVFDNAFSTSSWTAPSTASLFTGQYPTQHGLQIGFDYQRTVQMGMRQEKLATIEAETGKPAETTPEQAMGKQIYFQTLPQDATILSEVMKNSGYTTYCYSANPNVDRPLYFDQGFDYFEYKNMMPVDFIYDLLKQNKNHIRNNSPYFLYFQLMDTHMPYHKRAPYYKKQKDDAADFREAYLSEISYLDEYVEKMYREFEWDKNTILLFVTDHGEEFYDHGAFNHGPTLYRELNSALTMFHAPALDLPPRRVSQNVSLIDILPTFVELMNAEKPSQDMEGISLVPLLKEDERRTEFENQLEERTLFAQRVRAWYPDITEVWASIHKDRKLVIDTKEGGTSELFDLVNDVKEKNDLSASEPETYDRLFKELEKFRSQTRVNASIGMLELDEQLEEELDALGYLK